MISVLFTLIIILSAFLLFQVQPILSKEQLPLFGGGASVWSTSIFFYQTLLLLGYLYAHLMSKLPVTAQMRIHLVLMVIAASVTFSPINKNQLAALSPSWSIISNLTLQIGPLFLIMSATSILLQRWYSSTFNTQVPYHWYALSNIGSLLALLSFPFFFEVHFSLTEQKQMWLVGLMGIIVMMGLLVLCISHYSTASSHPNTAGKLTDTFGKNSTMCIALAACSSMCLVSTTQMISINIPPMPLVWILPLAVYLLTYILAFWLPPLKNSVYALPIILFAVMAGMLMYFFGGQFNTQSQLSMYLLVLFICCFFCHASLKRLAPNTLSMTSFYLCIAFGSVIGSFISSVVSPSIFNQPLEYPITLLTIIALYALQQKKSSRSNFAKVSYVCAFLLCTTTFVWLNQAYTQLNIASIRNFYGFVSVKDINQAGISERRLVDGTTIHGAEPLKSALQLGGSYYHKQTGVAQAFAALKSQDPVNIGVIGLGAGVLAQFVNTQDTMTFYELNPAVHYMAQNYFSYLQNSKAKIDVKIGDGRTLIQHEVDTKVPLLNALVIDAFSSDVIPTHLLTKEALELYWQRMDDKGVLIIHISNNHIDLMPIIYSHSDHFDKSLMVFNYEGNKRAKLGSKWVLLTNNKPFMKSLPEKHKVDFNAIDNLLLTKWTDDHHSLLPLLKL